MKTNKMHKIKIMVIGLSLIILAQTFGQLGPSNVSMTKHNLTSSGPGDVKTTQGGESCRFCHTPHASNPIAPLWNRNNPGTYYQTYESTTLVATVNQPTGSSRLCLSCHDGTIALNQTFNPRNRTTGTLFLTPADRGYLGRDLSDDHPISFEYSPTLATTKGELVDPNTLTWMLPLDHNRQVQCTTCHDPHNDSNGQFLRMSNQQSQMCKTCHKINNWESSSHAMATNALSGSTKDEWDNLKASSVKDAACGSCHRPHTAGGSQRLLRHAPEEDNCLNCHDGSVAKTNIDAELNKISVHNPKLTTGVHDPTEKFLSMQKHVECVDCHNSHKIRPGQINTKAPTMPASMNGVSGMSSTGRFIKNTTNEYEVCFKCHSKRNSARVLVDRVLGTDNIADEFNTNNASYHPVMATGKSTDVPSLKQGYNASSRLYCIDCHTSDSSDVKGPHGSKYRPLLNANYQIIDMSRESPQAYDHCYRCHERSKILDNKTFKYHKKHIVGKRTPCSVCHDPHGVKDNTRLINFDRNVVKADTVTGKLEFKDTGFRRGTCYLNCHGVNHSDEDYKP